MEEPKDAIFLDNKPEHQFELYTENQKSIVQYEIKGNRFILLHTEVPESLQGKGLAKILVEKTLQTIDSYGMKIIPVCPYIVSYLKKNSTWNHLWK
jgi:predicted GNAT family acetyltransferase